VLVVRLLAHAVVVRPGLAMVVTSDRTLPAPTTCSGRCVGQAASHQGGGPRRDAAPSLGRARRPTPNESERDRTAGRWARQAYCRTVVVNLGPDSLRRHTHEGVKPGPWRARHVHACCATGYEGEHAWRRYRCAGSPSRPWRRSATTGSGSRGGSLSASWTGCAS